MEQVDFRSLEVRVRKGVSVRVRPGAPYQNTLFKPVRAVAGISKGMQSRNSVF